MVDLPANKRGATPRPRMHRKPAHRSCRFVHCQLKLRMTIMDDATLVESILVRPPRHGQTNGAPEELS